MTKARIIGGALAAGLVLLALALVRAIGHRGPERDADPGADERRA